jgi:hypothetical protein
VASIISTFDKTSVGTVSGSGTEYWIDILANGPDTNSPIPSGLQIWIGFVTLISWDKPCQVSLRPNLPTKSAGSDSETQIRGFSQCAAGESIDLDVYYGGAIQSLAPVVAQSTGVEKLWLKIKSTANSAATFDYVVYYTIY